MDKSVLYVTDLDGTLMQSNGTLSAYTVSVINRLVEQGLAFTYATARSVESARTITGDLRLCWRTIKPESIWKRPSSRKKR